MRGNKMRTNKMIANERRANEMKANETRANKMVNNEIEKLEKELYSKECIAESINFVVNATSNRASNKDVNSRFSCNLVTILTRDKEVVAVRLVVLSDGCKVYLSKNSAWLEDDITYLNNIERFLKHISEHASMSSDDTDDPDDIGEVLTNEIMRYCSAKLSSRFEKLKNDIICGQNYDYIKDFINYASIDVSKIHEIDIFSIYTISNFCYEYYQKVKDFEIDSKFLGHIKKVGSYFGAVVDITACAQNIKYKHLFSKFELHIMKPDIITNQPIFSWKNIITRFTDDDGYERFMNRCLKKSKVMKKVRKIYTNKATQQLQLDGDDIKRRIYLHAEMNILASMINEKNKNNAYIAVSKRCCYLCELYIDFARIQGYDIIVSGKHRKIYSEWKLPHVNDDNFKIRSLKYILENLNRIIENKIKRYTSNSLLADSDDSGNNDRQKKKVREYFSKYRSMGKM